MLCFSKSNRRIFMEPPFIFSWSIVIGLIVQYWQRVYLLYKTLVIQTSVMTIVHPPPGDLFMLCPTMILFTDSFYFSPWCHDTLMFCLGWYYLSSSLQYVSSRMHVMSVFRIVNCGHLMIYSACHVNDLLLKNNCCLQ